MCGGIRPFRLSARVSQSEDDDDDERHAVAKGPLVRELILGFKANNLDMAKKQGSIKPLKNPSLL